MGIVATIVTNRRTPRSEQRRRIAEAALSLWREADFDTVSVDAIVARAGVSKGAFFTFFPTKAAALSLYGQLLEGLMQPAQALLDPARPLSSLDAFAAAAEQVLNAEGALAAALYRELGGRAYGELTAVHRAVFTDFVERAQACGTLDPDMEPGVAGDLICGQWTAAVLDWASSGDGLAARLRPRLRLLICGLGV